MPTYPLDRLFAKALLLTPLLSLAFVSTSLLQNQIGESGESLSHYCHCISSIIHNYATNRGH